MHRNIGLGRALTVKWSAKSFVILLAGISVCSCKIEPRESQSAELQAPQGAMQIVEAFRARQSDLVVESSGVVVRILSDDTHFPRHQRFILRVADDLTVLVAHNIDLAPRAAVDPGDHVFFRGEYEWNEKGGVIHWTHHDPEGRRPGGWLEVNGQRYQ